MSVSAASSFTDLPKHLRLKIYHAAGIVRPCPVDIAAERGNLVWRRNPRSEDWMEEHCLYRIRARGDTPHDGILRYRRSAVGSGKDCICPPLPTQLLYVSRSVYDDVLPLLYGLNRFRFYYRSGRSLSRFRQLGERALACITCLHVRLNFWPCARGHDWPNHNDDDRCGLCSARQSKESPMTTNTDLERWILQYWRTICQRLGDHLTPGIVAFSFICDAVDLRTAKVICRHLRLLPKVKECALRLGRHPSQEIELLCQETAHKLLHSTQYSLSSPRTFHSYSLLPTELRLLILSHAGLRLPDYNRYSWEEGIRVINNRIRYSEDCCERCTTTHQQCCCPRSHAAFSTTCICWRLPFALLSTTKQLRAEAYEVLVSSNCISFCQEPGQTLELLKALPPHTLKHFRHIKFLWSDSEHIKPWFEGGMDVQWRDLIEFVRMHFTLSRLRLTIQCRDNRDAGIYANNINEIRYIFDTYVDMIGTLRQLRGLHSFQAELQWFRDLEQIAWHVLMTPQYDWSLPAYQKSTMDDRKWQQLGWKKRSQWHFPWPIPYLETHPLAEGTDPRRSETV